MTTPTLTCDTCDSEIDVAKDPRCVVYDPSEATDVKCAECRKQSDDRWHQYLAELREAYKIKRGWSA